MENNQDFKQEGIAEHAHVSLFNNSMRYGLITAGVYVLVSLLFYVLDVDRAGWVNYLTFIVLIAGIVIGTIAYRDKHSGGFLSYGRCLASGVLISLVVGVIMGLYTYVFFQFFDPGEVSKMLATAEEGMAGKGLTDEQIDQAMKVTSKFMTPPIMAVSGLFSMVLWGTVFSLITSIFLKRNNDSFEETFPTT